jgi:hypothetical protein
MTDSQSSFSEVPALLEERQRYETWLSALTARRESTPQHVFERVQADYRARLGRVTDRLASHRQAIEDERGKLQARCSALLADERLRRDERAELELRAHVGELAGGDAETAFGQVDQAIGTLVEERRGLESRIGELNGLLGEPAKPEPTTAAGPSAPEAQAATAAVAVEAAKNGEADKGAAAPASEVPVAVAQAIEPAPPAATVPAAAAAPAAPVKPESAAPIVPPAGAGGATAPAEGARARGGRASFDELAFLSSVVGKNDGGAHAAKKEGATAGASKAAAATAAAATAAPVAAAAATVAAPKHDGPLVERRSTEPLLRAGIVQEENAATESLLAGLENVRLAAGEQPLAANVSANTPIVLRPSTTLEQAKTLKCNECGGLNYPTEWYCERCGAELAAL